MIFVLSVFILLFVVGAFIQVFALIIAGTLGFAFVKNSDEGSKKKIKLSRNINILILFFILLFCYKFSSRYEF